MRFVQSHVITIYQFVEFAATRSTLSFFFAKASVGLALQAFITENWLSQRQRSALVFVC